MTYLAAIPKSSGPWNNVSDNRRHEDTLRTQDSVRGFVRSAMRTNQLLSERALGSDAESFAEFLAGDDRAFHRLFEQHNQRLFTYAFKLVSDEQAAEDVVQQMWERVIQMRQRPPEDEVQNPVGLFVRIVRNLALDHRKHAGYQRQLGDVTQSELPTSHHAELSAEEEMVIRSLDTLPAETKEILVLHYYSGYSFDEIAGMLGKKSNAIWTRVSRARAELKKQVERELARETRTSGLATEVVHPRSEGRRI